jgi:hypothetical protein
MRVNTRSSTTVIGVQLTYLGKNSDMVAHHKIWELTRDDYLAHQGSKPFIEVQVRPPFHCRDVTKPVALPLHQSIV